MTPLLSAKKIAKHFEVGSSTVKAVSDFSLDIYAGDAIGIAGESGSGKTTLGKMFVHLLAPSEGSIFYEGEDLSKFVGQRRMRQELLQIVLQDPYGALNPQLTVEQIVGEGLKIHRIHEPSRILKALMDVGLPSTILSRKPHELSGGQRQRLCIARSLVLKPRFLVIDEGVSALDIVHQRQLIELFKDLQLRRNLTYLFISHDLRILRALCNKIGIMYRGQLVELGEAAQVLDTPKHPYTQALVNAIPIPDPHIERNRGIQLLKGEPPHPFQLITGCQFHPRCEKADAFCEKKAPELENGLRCHRRS